MYAPGFFSGHMHKNAAADDAVRSGFWSGIRESNPPILLGKQVFYQ